MFDLGGFDCVCWEICVELKWEHEKVEGEKRRGKFQITGIKLEKKLQKILKKHWPTRCQYHKITFQNRRVMSKFESYFINCFT